jgi:imidazolonepropionase-like amidohydrolase
MTSEARTGRGPTLTRTACAWLAALAVTKGALAQANEVPAPPQDRPIAIVHATIHTAAAKGPSVIEDGHVLFEGGRIVSIGPGLPKDLAANARTYDARGLHVAPGFIATMTQIGLVEILSVRSTDDRDEAGDLSPEAIAALAINPDTDLFPVARAGGVLLALTTPIGGLVSGRASALRLDGWTPEQIAIDPDVGVVVQWPLVDPVFAWWTKKPADEQTTKIRKDLATIDRFFTDAAAYLDRVDAAAGAPDAAAIERDQRFEALRGVYRGKDPVYITAGSSGQIASAVAWAKRRGLRPVIVGGRGIEASIPLLKEHAVDVILSGTHRLPGHAYDSYEEPYALPAKLRDAGIRFAIATADEPAHERNLPHHAGTAAAFGLTPHEALVSITRSAAELSGIGDHYGSLEEGKSATLIVTTGDPLEITSDVVLAFIDGRTIDLGSRQTRLLEKYREKYRQLGIPLDIRSVVPPATKGAGQSP